MGVGYMIDGGINLPFAGSAKISFDQAQQIAKNEIPTDANFTGGGATYFHVSTDGTIHEAGQLRHDIIWSEKVNCAFSITPRDGKDHFVYVVTFTNDKIAVIVVVDDQNGKILDTKTIPKESYYCKNVKQHNS